MGYRNASDLNERGVEQIFYFLSDTVKFSFVKIYIKIPFHLISA